MDQSYKSYIIRKILSVSGIVIAPVHSIGIVNYVERQLKLKNLTIEQYCSKLDSDKSLMNDLINQATTNETYFFREEKQFDYLQNVLFPKFRNKKLVIWSAACSTGEEPLSLLALALHFNIKVEVYASDIDDNVLNFFKQGAYSKYSFRRDGKKYHEYLRNLGVFSEDKNKFIFKPEILNKIKIFKYNLKDFINFPIPEQIDIIFMRNVFIYFDKETRKKITKKVTEKLNPNGHLFYSINEIGNINCDIVPKNMEKVNYDQIYFYMKKVPETFLGKEGHETALLSMGPKDVFIKLKQAIRKNDFSEAEKIAESYKPTFSDSFYSSFFKGYVLMRCNKSTEAEKYFITSEFMKSEFWPVYYFHGFMLEQNSAKDKANIYYKKCMEIMKSCYSKHKDEYDFLLGDITPSFIYSYCSKCLKG